MKLVVYRIQRIYINAHIRSLCVLSQSEGESSDTDKASVDDCEEDTEPDDDDDDDDDEFVDAGDEVTAADRSPWVNERRHSGDGEVLVYSSLIFSHCYVTLIHLGDFSCANLKSILLAFYPSSCTTMVW